MRQRGRGIEKYWRRKLALSTTPELSITLRTIEGLGFRV
jgi:hypothetical protein